MEQGVVSWAHGSTGSWRAGLGGADYAARNAEMTDFARVARQRGNALARHCDVPWRPRWPRGVDLFYTIARALPRHEHEFARQGFRFAGTMVETTRNRGAASKA
jgi:hypothetical protein